MTAKGTIQIAWHPHEDLWVEAAFSLPKNMRFDAIQDVAYMACRSFDAVQRRGWFLAAKRRKEAADKKRRAIAYVRRPKYRPYRAPRLLLTEISKPTTAQLMAGRASRSATTGMR